MKKNNNKQTVRRHTIRSSILLYPVILATIGGAFYEEAVASGTSNSISLQGIFKAQEGSKIYIGKYGKIGPNGKIINRSKNMELNGKLTFSGTNTSPGETEDDTPSAIHNHGDIFYYNGANLSKNSTTSAYAYHIDYNGFAEDSDNTEKATKKFYKSPVTTVDAYKYDQDNNKEVYSSTKFLDSDDTRAKAAYFDLVNDKPEGTTEQFNIYQNARTYTEYTDTNLNAAVFSTTPFSDSKGFTASINSTSYEFSKISDDEYEGKDTSKVYTEVIRSYDSFYKGPNIREVPSWTFTFVDQNGKSQTIGTVYRVGNIYKFVKENGNYANDAIPLTYDKTDNKYKSNDGKISFTYDKDKDADNSDTITYTDSNEGKIVQFATQDENGVDISPTTNYEYEYREAGEVKTKLLEPTDSDNTWKYGDETLTIIKDPKNTITLEANDISTTYELNQSKNAYVTNTGDKTIRLRDNIFFLEHAAAKASNYEGYNSTAEATIQSRLENENVIGYGLTFKRVDNDLVQNETKSNNAYDIGSATRALESYTNTLEYDPGNANEEGKKVQGSFYSIYGYEKGYAKADDYLNGATNFLYGRNKKKDKDGNLTGEDGTPVNIPPVDENSVLAVKATGETLSAYNEAVCNELCESGFRFSSWADDDPVITYSGDNSYYNGVFKQESGGVVIPNTGSIFGGRYEMGSIDKVNKVADDLSLPEYNSLREYHDALTGPERYEEAKELLDELKKKNRNKTLTQDDALDFFYLASDKFKDFIEDISIDGLDSEDKVQKSLVVSGKQYESSEILSTDSNGVVIKDNCGYYYIDARKLLYSIGKSLQQNVSDSSTKITDLENYDNFNKEVISTLFNTLGVKNDTYKKGLETKEAEAKKCQEEIRKRIITGDWDPAELEWQGGPKDEYNRPSIVMAGGSTIYFNLLNKYDSDTRAADATYYVKRNDGTFEEYDDGKKYYEHAVQMKTELKYYRAQEDDNGAWVCEGDNYRKLNTSDNEELARYSMIETDSTDQDGNQRTDIFVKNIENNQYEAYSLNRPYDSTTYEYQESELPKIYDTEGTYCIYDSDNNADVQYDTDTQYCSSGYQYDSTTNKVQLYKSDIFSFYGSLHGTENDRVIFEHGHVKIKGDCSGFLGSVGVVQGAEFTVEQSDSTSSSVYKGSFPQANVYQVKNDGSLVTPGEMTLDKGSFTTINSQNMENVKFNNGAYELNGQDGQTQLNEVSVGAGAIVKATDSYANLNGCTIEGVLDSKLDINSVNTTINGGVLVARSLTTQNSNTGSTFVSWGNDNYKDVFTITRVGQNQGAFRIQDDHSLKFFADFSVEDKDTAAGDDIYQSDRINAGEADVVDTGKGIWVAGMNIKGTPTEDVYKFMVYTGIAGAQTMPINLGADYGDEKYDTLQVYSNAQTGTSANFKTTIDGLQWYAGRQGQKDIPYTYTQTGADALTVTKDGSQTHTDNGNKITSTYAIDIDGLGNIYYVGALGTTNGATDNGYLYLFRAAGSSAANADQISNILGHYVTADTGYEVLGTLDLFNFINSGTSSRDVAQPGRIITPAKYRLWNKTFGEHSTIEMNTGFDSKLSAIGTMFGFDMEAKALKSKNLYLIPTVFAGVEHNMIKYASTKYRTDSYFGGIKGALFNSKHAVEIYGLYEFYRTKASSTRMKTHAVSLGTKYEYNLPMRCNWSFRPGVFASYVYLHSPSFETGVNSSTHKIKNRHKFEVAPVVSLNRQCGLWNSRAFVSYHQKFGTKGKTTINTTTYSIDKAKKYFMEYGLEVSRINAKDTAKFGLKLSRKTLGVKGFKGALTVGVKF